MKTDFPQHPWIDPHFHTNRCNFPPEELLKYAGQQVAWSWDGTRILASAPDDTELWRKLAEAGIDPQRVVFGYVDPPDVSRL